MSSRPLSEPEYTALVNHLANRPRDLLLLILGCSSGYRITELLSLKWQQVWDTETGTAPKEVLVARRNLKGGAGLHCRSVRSRRVPLNERAREAIANYASALPHPPTPESYLFSTSRSGDGPMDRSMAFRILVRAAQACGIDEERISTHTLRKTFVARVYSASGHDLIKTQRIIGHASPMTTARYLETDQSELDELVRNLAA
jgi:integrase